jgi:hypothetical protein
MMNLRCVRCRLDATVPLQQQVVGYTRHALDRHLETDFHSRREQIKRLLCLDKNDVSRFKCPFCSADNPATYREAEGLAHMDSVHEEEMRRLGSV